MKYIWPVQPNISQGFGESPDYYKQFGQQGHNGIDLAVPSGTPVKAATDGVINFEGWGVNNGLMGSPAGLCVIVDHGDVMTGYAHLNNTIVNQGQQVKQGETIGFSGATGAATGPHVHFEFIGKPANTNNGFWGRLNPAPFNVGVEDKPPELAPFQRTSMAGTRYRLEPNRSALMHPKFPNGLTDGDWYDFKGFVHGESVEGNDIWFVGMHSGGYAWSGGFYDPGTHDLPDLTPNTSTPPVVDPPVVTPPSIITYPSPTTDIFVERVYNKKNPIAADYVPNDLVNAGSGTQLRREASTALHLMQAASGPNLFLTPVSGYRSYEKQREVYNGYVSQNGQAEADTYSARPGYSEHQSGLAVDLSPISDAFVQGPEFPWLVLNAHKFGFVLRYPVGKESVTGYMFEPWHWRYVGVKVATDIYDKAQQGGSRLTLEEYFQIAGGKYPDQDVVTPTPENPVPTDPPTTTPDPLTPSNPPETVPPVPEPEATASARAFIARVGSQLGAASIIAVGLSASVTLYTGWTIPLWVQGLLTFAIAGYIIYQAQKGYKLNSGFKWPF